MEYVPPKLGATLFSHFNFHMLFIYVIKIFAAKYPRDQPFRLCIFASNPFEFVLFFVCIEPLSVPQLFEL